MPTYDSVSQSNSSLLPVEYANEVIRDLPAASAVLGMSRRVNMPARTQVLPVLSVLPTAYWVGGANDSTTRKQTSKAEWKNVNLVVDEIAVLVPIPDAYMADSQFPVWEETKPLVTEAIGAAIDAATLFGVNKPTTWPTAIYQASVFAGNMTASDSGDDIAQAIALSAARLVKEDGYAVNGFAVEPGFGWQLVGLRSTADGIPIYQTDLAGPIKRGLYGFPMGEVKNGGWDSDEAEVIMGDWSKSIVGIRQDITFTRHTDGIISDDSGVVVFNAMQQDSTIWRAVMRIAWATANPANRLAADQSAAGTGRYPFWTILSAGTYDYS